MYLPLGFRYRHIIPSYESFLDDERKLTLRYCYLSIATHGIILCTLGRPAGGLVTASGDVIHLPSCCKISSLRRYYVKQTPREHSNPIAGLGALRSRGSGFVDATATMAHGKSEGLSNMIKTGSDKLLPAYASIDILGLALLRRQCMRPVRRGGRNRFRGIVTVEPGNKRHKSRYLRPGMRESISTS